MVDILETDKLLLFIVLIIPGFISMKVWNLLVPSQNRALNDYLFDALAYSFLNFALLFWLLLIVQRIDQLWVNIVLLVILLVIFPVLWPILWKIITTAKFLRGKIIHPTPKAWDYFFSLGKPCFMLVHLKDGNLIGGLYQSASFASSYPDPEDLYIQEVWKIDENGSFLEKMPQTAGMLLTRDSIDYIELYNLGDEEGESDG